MWGSCRQGKGRGDYLRYRWILFEASGLGNRVGYDECESDKRSRVYLLALLEVHTPNRASFPSLA